MEALGIANVRAMISRATASNGVLHIVEVDLGCPIDELAAYDQELGI